MMEYIALPRKGNQVGFSRTGVILRVFTYLHLHDRSSFIQFTNSFSYFFLQTNTIPPPLNTW